jgi:hypothetical protein
MSASRRSASALSRPSGREARRAQSASVEQSQNFEKLSSTMATVELFVRRTFLKLRNAEDMMATA